MRADQITGLKVVGVTGGTDLGKVSGVLLNTAEKRIVAIAVSAAGVLHRTSYIPIQNVVSIENDVVTVPSEQSLVDRRNFPTTGVIDHLAGRKVLTEDGKDLGTVKSYGFDAKSGELQYVSFGVDKPVLGGLMKSSGETYEVPASFIKTFGDHVIVDNSVPDVVGVNRAA